VYNLYNSDKTIRHILSGFVKVEGNGD